MPYNPNPGTPSTYGPSAPQTLSSGQVYNPSPDPLGGSGASGGGVGGGANINGGGGTGFFDSLGHSLGYGNAPVTGPSRGAYGAQVGNSTADSNTFAQRAGAAAGRQGPQINNQYGDASRNGLDYINSQENGLAGTLQGQINGTGPSIAQNQFNHAQDQSIASTMALANSSNGGAVARAGALRGAQQQNGATLAAGTSQAGALRLQEQQGAIGQLAGLYGQQGQRRLGQYGMENQNAQDQAHLMLQNRGQNDQYALGLGGLQNQASGQSEQALNDYYNQLHGAQGLNAQQQGAAAEGAGRMVAGAAGAAEGALMSDARVKEDMEPGGDVADDFLRRMSPREYKYINPGDAPSGGGSYLGVTAQDLERVKGVGHNLVTETPRGKAVNQPAALSAVMAGLGRLHERMSAMEKGRR